MLLLSQTHALRGDLSIKMSGIGTRRCNRFIGELLNVRAKCKDLGEYWHINVFTVAQLLEDNTKIERVRGRERERGTRR